MPSLEDCDDCDYRPEPQYVPECSICDRTDSLLVRCEECRVLLCPEHVDLVDGIKFCAACAEKERLAGK